MINRGHHYKINNINNIVSNIYTSKDPVYPESCPRGSMAVGEFGGIWVLLSP